LPAQSAGMNLGSGTPTAYGAGQQGKAA